MHSLTDVNHQLKRGRPFFGDIVRDGIALYEAEDHPFEQPQRLSADARGRKLRRPDEWFQSAGQCLVHGVDAAQRGWGKKAACELHQAAERSYLCTLLVVTLYRPKSHKLNFLRSQAERIAPPLIAAWLRASRFEQRGFELLRRAYVDARYSPHFKVTDKGVAWLTQRIGVPQELVRNVCKAHLAS